MPNPHPDSIAARVLAYAAHPRWISRRVAWEFLRRVRDRVVIRTPQGNFTVRTANRVIGTQLYTRRTYEEGILRHAMGVLAEVGRSPQGRTVLDVGANIGMSSIALVNGGYCERAIAIEPEPQNFADLVQNVRENGLDDRVQCHQFAVSDHNGTLTMELADVNFGDHRVQTTGAVPGRYGEAERRTASVRASTLDTFVSALPPSIRDDLACLWIDVQGYDAYALRGARALIARGTPAITEFWPYGIQRAGVTPNEYVDLLGSMFQSCYVVRDTARSPRQPIEAVRGLFAEIGDGIADLTLVLLP